MFQDHGYDDTSFIAGMTDHELEVLGVHSKAHRNALTDAIKQLPATDIDPAVPVCRCRLQYTFKY